MAGCCLQATFSIPDRWLIRAPRHQPSQHMAGAGLRVERRSAPTRTAHSGAVVQRLGLAPPVAAGKHKISGLAACIKSAPSRPARVRRLPAVPSQAAEATFLGAVSQPEFLGSPDPAMPSCEVVHPPASGGPCLNAPCFNWV